MSEEKKSRLRIEVYKLTNYLKNKLGLSINSTEEGEIAPDKIEECDALIQEMCESCLETIGTHLDEIIKLWGKMKDMPQSQERQNLSDQIFIESHEIKDIASLCGYALCAHFAESLRDYISETSLNVEGQRVIIQAHVDAMTVVYKKDLKDDGGPAAEELKKMVKVAIDKFR